MSPGSSDAPAPAPTARLIAATQKVVEHLRAPRPGDPRLPILNFTEARGGGADVLEHLYSELDQKAPRAQVDCANYETEEIPELITEVKRQLAHQCEAYPGLHFRRLEVGLALIQKRIDPAVAGETRRMVVQAARRTFAPPPLDNGTLPGLIGLIAPRFAWVGALAVTLSRSPSLYDFYRWYGHRDQNRATPPTQVMEQLNRWAFPHKERGRVPSRLVDGFLIEALLADIRSGYGRGRLSSSKHRWYNSVVLLRNADKKGGVPLLKLLQAAREHLKDAGVRAEALLVIAGSQQPIEMRDEPVDGVAT